MTSEVDAVDSATRHLSLEPPVASFASRRNARQSTLESADQAAGIFSLYGDPNARDSWQSSGSQGDSDQGVAYDPHEGSHSQHVAGPSDGYVEESSNGYRNSTLRESMVAGEESRDHPTAGQETIVEPMSPQSWDGPMSELNGGSRFAAAQQQLPQLKAPNITVTPEKKSRNSLNPSSNRNSMLGSTTSSAATTPTHRSVQRLSPHPLGSSVNSVASSNGSIGQNGSQASVAGSSQYPGEEADAFHVRSTC